MDEFESLLESRDSKQAFSVTDRMTQVILKLIFVSELTRNS